MRVRDPIGGPPDLGSYFDAYDRYFRQLDTYELHHKRLVAGYSRGDSQNELLSTFFFAVEKLVRADEKSHSEYGKNILAHDGRFAGVLREALVYLTFGLCLRAPRRYIEDILRCCDRGDPLLETLAHAAAPGSEVPHTEPAFYEIFDGLYDALNASGAQRALSIQKYLQVWYEARMDGFPFKDEHLLTDPTVYVGYWCFEAAGIVAALGIDDASFANHPHYPKDLVDFYRTANTS